MEFVNHFRQLEVYKASRKLSNLIYLGSTKFPKEEMYSLTDQVRRSSGSIGAQIAEAWGKRRYKKHFISKLTDALSEEFETQHWIGVAVDRGYLLSSKADEFMLQCDSIGRMLNAMIDKADRFCKPKGK